MATARIKNARGGIKPRSTPSQPHSAGDPTSPLIEENWIWCPLKSEWRHLIPEEQVRQGFILRLWHRYGYGFDQMDQERRTKHGHRSPKVDIVVWESPAAKQDGRSPIIVVECKSDNVSISPDDYEQGDSYARAGGCEFLVTHNNKETRFFRIIPGVPGKREDIENIPKRDELSDSQQMEKIRRATKAFSREEFRKLLFDCHCILRDNHKMEPGKAFDEISKILFIKMYVERTGNEEKFSVKYLDDYARIRRRKLEEVMNDLFEDTKTHYKADDLFGNDDRLNISFATFRRIVERLQRFNLAATSDDVKGIAFERFLGQTFRGELGQFFTPRPIVDFMVELIDPSEGDVLCDPASGSGGFLIKFFEYVRGKIEVDIHAEKKKSRRYLATKGFEEGEAARKINAMFASLNMQLDITQEGSKLWKLAHECIFGVDAEPRAARTSKMNMIMHGDGHGGIHHHDGFVDVNGIFPGRFGIVLTNPPFGATVGDDQKVGDTLETKVSVGQEIRRGYEERFGVAYRASYERMLKAEQNRFPIISLYDLGQGQESVKTEVLYLERCLGLLTPGGRLGIVVPDGTLNNPSLSELRDYIEDRARILAVVSIPDKTFRSAKTAVKASLLFLQTLSESEKRKRKKTGTKSLEQAVKDLTPQVELLTSALKVTWKTYSGVTGETASRRKRNKLDQAAVSFWKPGFDEQAFKQAQKTTREQLRDLEKRPSQFSRLTTRTIHDYPIFMAVAEHVGIRASGKTDPENDLPTILEAWRNYLRKPDSVSRDPRQQIFQIQWAILDRWDPASFRPIDWKCADDVLRPLGLVLKKRSEPVDREEWDFSDLVPITIHFDGSIEERDMTDTDDYTMALFFARPRDIVVSKIDLKNGAVGIVPDSMTNVVVTNHFVVYEPDVRQVYPPYLIRLIQTKFFKDYLWRKKVGSEGRKEVKIDLFECTKIPLPDVKIQEELVAEWVELEKEAKEIEGRMAIVKESLHTVLLSGDLGASFG